VDDRLCRHDLNDEEWQRLLPMMPLMRVGAAGGPITGW